MRRSTAGSDSWPSRSASALASELKRNPFADLADVIPRVQDHPKRRLDELLPGSWAHAQANAYRSTTSRANYARQRDYFVPRTRVMIENVIAQ